MKISNSEYKKIADSSAKKSPALKNCISAFLFGGSICMLGQGFKNLYEYLKLPRKA
jgi:stage V sporulation protein AC